MKALIVAALAVALGVVVFRFAEKLIAKYDAKAADAIDSGVDEVEQEAETVAGEAEKTVETGVSKIAA